MVSQLYSTGSSKRNKGFVEDNQKEHNQEDTILGTNIETKQKVTRLSNLLLTKRVCHFKRKDCVEENEQFHLQYNHLLQMFTQHNVLKEVKQILEKQHNKTIKTATKY